MSTPDSPPLRRNLWTAFGVMFGVWLVMAWLDLDLRNPTAPGGIVSLELAFTHRRFAAIVASWDADAVRSAWWSLGIDLVFMASYGVWLNMWVRAVALRLRDYSPLVSRWGRNFARLVWVSVAFDLLENASLAYALSAREALAGPVLAAGIFATIKFVLLISALFYALNGSVALWLGRARDLEPAGGSS